MRIRRVGVTGISPISDWIEQGQIKQPFCAVFRLTKSEYIDEIIEKQFFGEYDEEEPLVHYYFETVSDEIIEVIDNLEPIVEVEYL